MHPTPFPHRSLALWTGFQRHCHLHHHLLLHYYEVVLI